SGDVASIRVVDLFAGRYEVNHQTVQYRVSVEKFWNDIEAARPRTHAGFQFELVPEANADAVEILAALAIVGGLVCLFTGMEYYSEPNVLNRTLGVCDRAKTDPELSHPPT